MPCLFSSIHCTPPHGKPHYLSSRRPRVDVTSVNLSYHPAARYVLRHKEKRRQRKTIRFFHAFNRRDCTCRKIRKWKKKTDKYPSGGRRSFFFLSSVPVVVVVVDASTDADAPPYQGANPLPVRKWEPPWVLKSGSSL